MAAVVVESLPASGMLDHDSPFRARKPFDASSMGLSPMPYTSYSHHSSYTESLADASSLSHNGKSSQFPLDPALFSTTSGRDLNLSSSSSYSARESVDSGYGGGSWPTSSAESQRADEMSPPRRRSPITAWGSNNSDFASVRQRPQVTYTQSHYDDGHSEVASETTTNTNIYAQTAPTYQHSYATSSLNGDGSPFMPAYQSEDQWSSRKIGGASDTLAGIGGAVFSSSTGGVSPNAVWNPTAEEREVANYRQSQTRYQPYTSHSRTHSDSSTYSHPPPTTTDHFGFTKFEPSSIAAQSEKIKCRRRRGPQPSRETYSCPLITCRERNRTFKSKAEHRRHLLKHFRPFSCPFHFAGCSSVFSAKNEWQRHLISIHAYHETYQCKEPKCAFTHGTFNRKDLFKAHLLRTHKLEGHAVEAALKRGWNPPFKKSRNTGKLVQVREEEMWPSHLECGFKGCNVQFRHVEGENRKAVWDKWIEHRSNHCLNVETMEIAGEKGNWVEGEGLKTWAFDNGFVVFENNKYRVNMR